MRNTIGCFWGVVIMTACTNGLELERVSDITRLNPESSIKVNTVSLLERYGITDPEGFIKQGNLLVVGRSYEDYQVRAIDLQANTNREMLSSGKVPGSRLELPD